MGEPRSRESCFDLFKLHVLCWSYPTSSWGLLLSPFWESASKNLLGPVTFHPGQWHLISVTEMCQLTTNVHQGLTRTLKAMRHSYFRRSNEKSGGNRMFMVTANRCPPRVWLHLLEIKMLWHKCSSKWTGVQRWYTWHSADKRYQGTARADRGHQKDTLNREYSCEAGHQVAD